MNQKIKINIFEILLFSFFSMFFSTFYVKGSLRRRGVMEKGQRERTRGKGQFFEIFCHLKQKMITKKRSKNHVRKLGR